MKTNSSGAAMSASLASIALTSLVPTLSNSQELEEVIVTATRRAQDVQGIPYNISVLSGDQLVERGITDVNELLASLPGAVSADLGGRSDITSSLTIRGINASDAAQDQILTKPTANSVSTYINETPIFFNVRASDVERVEVLRGPQGTLYGSGAVGGTVRLLFNRPDFEADTLEFSSGIGSYSESDDLNSNIEAIGNLAISDNLAIRALVGYDKRAGVIDQIDLARLDSNGVEQLVDPSDQVNSPLATVREDDTDESELTYSRLSLLWEPNDATSVLASYHRQDGTYDDNRAVSRNPNAGEWESEQSRKSIVDRTVDIVSLEISHSFEFAELTSATSWSRNDVFYENDATELYRWFAYRGAVPVYGFQDRVVANEQYPQEAETVTQELRLVSNGDGKWDWLVGLYYSNEEFKQHLDTFERGYGVYQEDLAVGSALSGSPDFFGLTYPTIADLIVNEFGGTPASRNGANIFVWDFDNEFEDKAAFGELTYNATDAWQLTVGVRAFQQDYSQRVFTNFFEFEGFGFAGPINPPDQSFSDQIFKFNTSYFVNDDLNVYFTLSEGFRRGGTNPVPELGVFADPNVPVFYDPDTTTNYEIGAKGTFMDGRARYSVAGYLIEWEDLQFNLFTAAGFPAVFNGGEAESAGIEAELEIAVSDAFNMSLGYGYTDAETTENFNIGVLPGSQLFVADGSTLPGVPENTINLAGTYSVPLSNGAAIYLHANANYRDSISSTVDIVTPDPINNPSNFTTMEDYWLFNASLSYVTTNWTVGLHARNIFNEQTEQAEFVRNANSAALISPAAANAVGAGRLLVGAPRSIGIDFRYYLGF